VPAYLTDPEAWLRYLVGACVLAVLFGYLIPRRTANRENDYLRKALDKRDAQVDTLIKQNETVIALLEDIKAAGSRRVANRDA